MPDPKSPSSPLAVKLLDQLIQQGYTVAELAHKAGLSRQRLHAILAGADPRFSAVLRLCRALDVSLSAFDEVSTHV